MNRALEEWLVVPLRDLAPAQMDGLLMALLSM
jgi:hypothetical protein